MNDQQTAAAQAGISFIILLCSCISLVLMVGVYSFSIAAGFKMTWINWTFPVLNVISIACLLTDFKSQKSEAVSFVSKTVLYPSLALMVVCFLLGDMYSTSKEIHQSQIHSAYLKGKSEVYEIATKDLADQHQDCLKRLQEAYEPALPPLRQY